jgi:hypothetical protein
MFTSDRNILFCQACGNSTVIQQHLNGSKHTVASVGLKDWPGRQLLISESSVIHSTFATFVTELYESFMPMSMPLFKINNLEVRNSLLKKT